jgi:hypothetical protein
MLEFAQLLPTKGKSSVPFFARPVINAVVPAADDLRVKLTTLQVSG